ncbi:hypothetical protein HY415_02510 [Candidatus Kaiserbacteria bacterium]|nr:hypothetical protein [Candidatus Kaiserbacteria bacterium]
MNNAIPTLALMAAIGVFFFYVAPTWSGSIAEKKTSIAADEQALTAAIAYATQQNELAAARNAIDPANLARLTALLPSSVDNVGLILDLNALAARSGLALSNIDVLANAAASPDGASPNATGASPQTAANSVGSVDLSLTAVGTYTALQTFLRGVETSERLLDVQELLVKGSDTGVYTYQMKITLYWLR